MPSLLEKLASPALDPYRPLLEAFLASDYGALMQYALANLKPAYFHPSPIHGQRHNERVLLYGMLIARHERFSMHDAQLLSDACVYHDIGRVNDCVDDYHGERSSAKLPEVLDLTGDELRIVQAMTEAHSKDDRIMDDILRKWDVPDLPRSRMLARALKDADGLDRVRLDLLDPRYLRFPYSRTLIPLAWAMVK